MTISTTTIKNSFAGNNSTSAFTYTFKITANSEMQVIIRSSAGTETIKSLGTHYNVSGAGNSGGGTVNIALSGTNASLYTLRNVTDGTTGSNILYDSSKTFVLETANDFSGADYSHSVTITATNNLYGNTASGNVSTSGTYVADVFSNKKALVSSTQRGEIRNYLLTGTNQNPFADNDIFESLGNNFVDFSEQNPFGEIN